MDFIYDFDGEMLDIIVKKALKKGYKIRKTEWLDNWEREEGCPSVDHYLDDEDLEEFYEYEDSFYIFPEEPSKYGCAELNFVKGSEYICFYHIERGDEYICSDCLCFLTKKQEEKYLKNTIKKKEAF